MSNELHIFVTDDGDDWMIAYDATDARAVLLDIVGPEEFEPYGLYGNTEFVQWPDSDVFTLTEIDEAGHPQESHMPDEWVEIYGRCYLGGQA